jgi:cytochrome c-type biogenesis protein CcmH/NrfG
MSTGVTRSSARSGFVLGLSTGLVVATAFFLVRAELSAPATASASAAAAPGASSPMTASPASSSVSTPGAKAGSMEAATLALKTRLAAEGGPDDQWELLAQSYDFLGRSEEAKLARDHKVPAGSELRDAITASAMLLSAPRGTMSPRGAPQAGSYAGATLIAAAENHRLKREFKEACAAYAEAATLGAMTADAWADYADAQASLAGGLAGEPEKAIARALELDPKQTKALWLKASLAHEQRRYKDALATWRELLALVPAGSSDARIVEANIAEATRLATG